MEPWWDKPRDGMETKDLPTKSNNLTCAIISQSLPHLFQVEYPGFVENPANALRTLGGIHKVSQVLANPRKKLELRFRPGDVYCKPTYGEASVTCGLLIKLRRKKSASVEVPKSPDPSILIELSHLPDDKDKRPDDPSSLSLLSDTTQYRIIERNDKQQMIVFDGPLPESLRENLNQQLKQNQNEVSADDKPKPGRFEAGHKILEEEQKFLEELTLKKRFRRCANDDSVFSKDVGAAFKQNRIYLKVPYNINDIRAARSNFEMEVLGIIPRNYKFKGMCDFQYLPMKKTKKRHVSIMNKILPAFGNPDVPDSTPENLLVCRLASEGHDKNVASFLVPNIMSRVDKPLDDLFNFLEGGVAKDSIYKHQPHVLSSTRTKRVIHSHLCNFRVTDENINSSECLIPSGPMQLAIDDAAKRGLLGSHLDHVKSLFEKRPIYTRIQVEAECAVGLFSLKYLLPVVAYFALNGPWRSCWIRYGYDPRKDRFAYAYQLLDYRLPNPYRSLMERKRNTTTEVERELLYKFQPNTIPPKCQMIYQICEIKTKEIDDLIKILHLRMIENDDQRFDTRYGFLSEDIIEYCRYSISRNIELCLFNRGKIPSVTLPEVSLPSGEDGDSEMSDLTFQPGTWHLSRISQTHGRKGGVDKRKLRPRRRAFPFLEADEASNQSSNVADLKIRENFDKDTASQSESDEDEDDDQRIIQEALNATTLEDEIEGEYVEEVNPEDINPDQILGLE